MELTIWSDADHTGCRLTCRFHSGKLIFMNKALIMWCSKRQTTVKSAVYGSNYISTNQNRSTLTNSPKGSQINSRGRFTQSRYRLGNRTRVDKTSPRTNNRRPAVNRNSQTPKRTAPQPSRSVNRNNSYNSTPRRTYKNTPSYRSTSPSRSYNSGSSRSYNSSSGRSSTGGRRKQ